MRRYLPRLALILLLAPPCQAGPNWSDLLQGWLASSRGNTPYFLRVDGAGPGPSWWRQDDALVLLMEDRDLTLETLSPLQGRLLREARGWSAGPAWILLSRDGEVVGEGQGLPGGEAVRAALSSGGYQTVWVKREAFLAEHPDQGEALEARLFAALGLLRARFLTLAAQGQATPPRLGATPDEPLQTAGKLFQFQPPPAAPKPTAPAPGRGRPVPEPGPETVPEPLLIRGPALDPGAQGPLADALYLETADTLERLLQVPDWWRLPRLDLFRGVLEAWDPGASPRMRGLLTALRSAVAEQWQRNPHSGGNDVGLLWTCLERVLEGTGTPVFPSLDPNPGRITPSQDQVNRMVRPLRTKGDWRGVLAFLAGLPLNLPEHPATPQRWREYTDRQATVYHLQALANATLGRWKDAELALTESRHWAGDAWAGLVAEHQRSFPETRLGVSAEFRFLLESEAEPYPLVPPVNAPVRMLLAGGRPWSRAWAELRNHPALAPWDPGELKWVAAGAADLAVLDRSGLPGPRWVALQGETVLATGARLPDPRVLAQQLAGAGSTRLERLEAFIAHNPDHLDARRDRFLLLRPRMPNPALEPLLAEDAALAWINPDPKPGGPWRPDPACWGPLTSPVVAELGAALHRWPSSARIWKLWLAWAALLPAPPSAHAFALNLPVYGPRGPWTAGLPLEAHAAVARELRAQGQYGAMRTWFQGAWDGLKAAPLAEEDLAKVDVLYRGLAEALTALGLREALADLKAELALLQPPEPRVRKPGRP